MNETVTLESLAARIARIERLVLYPKPKTGFICVCCEKEIPENWFWYEVFDKERGENEQGFISPLCANCLSITHRGSMNERPTTVCGPYKQPVTYRIAVTDPKEQTP